MAISETEVKAPLFKLLSSARQDEETRRHALDVLCNEMCQDEETVEAFVNMDMDDPQRVMREFRKHLNAVERMGPDVRPIVLDLHLTLAQRVLEHGLRGDAEKGVTDAAAGPLTEHAIRRLWMHTRMAHKLLEVRELYKTADLAEHVLIAQQMQGILQERIRRLEEFQHRLKTVQDAFGDCKSACREAFEAADAEFDKHKEEAEGSMDTVKKQFSIRMEMHDIHIGLMDEASKVNRQIIKAQNMLLNNRECGCLVIDKRRIRRCIYVLVAVLLIAGIVYAVLQMVQVVNIST